MRETLVAVVLIVKLSVTEVFDAVVFLVDVEVEVVVVVEAAIFIGTGMGKGCFEIV